MMLRWAHFILFTLAMLEQLMNRNSDIPDTEIEPTLDESQRRVAELKVEHRDSSRKLFARILGTISVFVYQGTVFFA